MRRRTSERGPDGPATRRGAQRLLVALTLCASACGPELPEPPPRPVPSVTSGASAIGTSTLRVRVRRVEGDPRASSVALFRRVGPRALRQAVADVAPAAAQRDVGWDVREAGGLPEGAYVVRATTPGRRVTWAQVELERGATRIVDLEPGDPGIALVAVPPAGVTLSRRVNLTVQKIGAGLTGDRRTIAAEPAERAWRFDGLSPGRYLLQLWDTRRATIVDVGDLPENRVELPAAPPTPPASASGSLRVRIVRSAQDARPASVALVAGDVTDLAPGTWMQCADAPATFDHLAPGRYTVVVFDGIAYEQFGWETGYRTLTVDVAADRPKDVELPID